MAEKEFQGWYLKNYKKLMIIPLLLLVLSLGQIFWQTYTTGEFIKKSVSLKGGISLNLLGDVKEQPIIDAIAQRFPHADWTVRTLTQAGTKTGIDVEIDLDVTNEQNVAAFKELILTTASTLKQSDIEENMKLRSPVLGSSAL